MSRRRFRVVVASVSFVAWTGTATAWGQEGPPPEAPPANFGPPPPGHEPPPPWSPGDTPTTPAPVTTDIGPTFMTLDRMDDHTRVGIQIGFDKLDDLALDEAFLMRFNPYGQVILPGTKVGLFGQVALAHAFVDGEDGTGLSNLELGGFYMPLPRSNDLILRASLVAATADDDDDSGAAANLITAYERMTDLILAVPEYTTGRLSASTIQQMDQFFFRADGGFDFVLSRPSAASGPSVFFRANVAGGYRIPDAVDLTAELVNYAAVNGDVTGGITERFIHTLAFSVRTPGIDQLHFGAVFPLDEDLRGELWILSLGYQRAWF
jgi:hypothetical protein